MIILKSKQELKLMREGGKIAASILFELRKFLKPGIRTIEIDKQSQMLMKKYNVVSAFLGYKNYPANICVAVNDEVIHSIPGSRRIKEGDIVNIDVGIIYKGYCVDIGATYPVGEISEEKKRLLITTEEALYYAIKNAVLGNRIGNISHSIQTYAEQRGYQVVRELCGHGIGRTLHEDPPIPNYGKPEDGPLLKEGMTLAIEPMINMGTGDVVVQDDGWTVVTADGKCSCQFEHTVAVTSDGPEILTKL